jgi:hypothetical protein
MPRVASEWWQVAGNPDLGELNGPAGRHPQQPVDFSVWQAADGTWQLWSCIRNTKCGGYTRLFYGWEGKDLTDADWKPMGIAMQADHPKYETNVGGLQAPHTILIDDVYHMIYGDWDWIAIQRSGDGKIFERWLYEDRTPAIGMFTEGKGCNTRDPMAIQIGDTWHVYYTAYPEVDGRKTGAVFCRTSKDLRNWSESGIVARGGLTGTGPSSSECPHVVHLGGYYYLFRTQRYAGPPTTSVYRSTDPMDFGVDNRADDRFVCLLEVAAPEIIKYRGQYYIAALMPDIQGIRIAELRWVEDKVAK